MAKMLQKKKPKEKEIVQKDRVLCLENVSCDCMCVCVCHLTSFFVAKSFQKYGDVLYIGNVWSEAKHPRDWEFADKSSRRRGLYSLENPFWLRTKAFLIHFASFRFFAAATLWDGLLLLIKYIHWHGKGMSIWHKNDQAQCTKLEFYDFGANKAITKIKMNNTFQTFTSFLFQWILEMNIYFFWWITNRSIAIVVNRHIREYSFTCQKTHSRITTVSGYSQERN